MAPAAAIKITATKLSLPSLRTATEADAPAIAGIYAHHVKNGTASFETEAPDMAEIMRRMKDISSKNLPYFVAELDGMVVGYAYAGPYRPRQAYRFTVENSIYVHPDYAGSGVGSLLMPELIRECRARGFRQMVAVIGDSTNTASIRLHEKFGFRTVGVLQDVGFKFGRWLDTVFMQLDLRQA